MTTASADARMQIALPEQLDLITPRDEQALADIARAQAAMPAFVPTETRFLGTFRTPLDVLADDDLDAGHFFGVGR